MEFFTDKDADLGVLEGKTIAVLGYGSQGSAQAMCMKDSGLNVIVGLRKGSESEKVAKDYGFEVLPVREAAKRADIVHVLVPDQVQAQVYKKEIEPSLGKGKALSFSHGFNIVFGFIKPPKNIDVFMVAPHSPGHEQRRLFLEGKGVPGLFAVHQNPSGRAKEFALAMAKACGFTRVGVYECSFREETFTDLFGEQAVLCGGLSQLVKAGFETLVKAGYSKEMAYFACVYEVKLIANLLSNNGIEGMFGKISDTAEYGARTRGPKIIDEDVKKRMKKILSDVESGKFAREWVKEHATGEKKLSGLRKKASTEKIELAYKSLRENLVF